jgi:hypothetical protein
LAWGNVVSVVPISAGLRDRWALVLDEGPGDD